MDYLYGNLNKLVELQKYKFTSSDNTILTSIDDNNYVDLKANTQKLVTLKQIRKDLDPSDDLIKYYGLFAFNSETKEFDIPLGDEIVISAFSSGGGDTSGGNCDLSSINSAYVKVGEQEDGSPIYHRIEVGISETGQLKLDKIPVSALTDQTIVDGSPVYIESVIDGNPGGEVY